MTVCIVMFTESATNEQIADYLNHIQENGATVKYYYEAIKGVAFETDSCEASFINDPIVAIVEPDGTGTVGPHQ
ncbi:unnamed protein product [Rhizoctonia solani]|uniref:Inhibitor I9 domain-containing protein n=1 Tax=Rhizoctonia solani TaxID=456999 RepID=A0A8H3CYZ6_9AGAM|nr:unnamed protein product [Rhizoctonia solani]